MALNVVGEQAERTPAPPPPAPPWWGSGPALAGMLALGGALLHLTAGWSVDGVPGAVPRGADGASTALPAAFLSAVLFGLLVLLVGLWTRALGGGTTAQLGAALAALGATVLWRGPAGTTDAATAAAAARCGVLLCALLLVQRWQPRLAVRGWLAAIAVVAAVLVAPGSEVDVPRWWHVGPAGLLLLGVGWVHLATLRRERAPAGPLSGALVTSSALLLAALGGASGPGAGPGTLFAAGFLVAVTGGLVLELFSARRGSRIFLLSCLLLLLLQLGVVFWRMGGMPW